MAYTYEWKINYMDTKLSVNGLEKVVVSCQWTVSGVDSEDPKIRTSNYGYCTFKDPEEDTFLAYDDLTEATVLDWIWANGVDRENVENGLASSMDTMRTPPTVILTNPWANVVNNVNVSQPDPAAPTDNTP